jgi:hypothetical protein
VNCFPSAFRVSPVTISRTFTACRFNVCANSTSAAFSPWLNKNRNLPFSPSISRNSTSAGTFHSDCASPAHCARISPSGCIGLASFCCPANVPRSIAIIPGSMGARSYIVRGKGNPESFMSCSHGAGRAMSRGEAKRRFTAGKMPMVMAAQPDLVEIVPTLRQVVCVKG